MNDLVFTVVREPSTTPASGEGYTLGKIYMSGMYFGETCEDMDRDMEHGGTKVYGKTAIPRGKYRLALRNSPHFGRLMPHVEDVPGFSEIMCHGGNHAEDSLGCILLGRVRTLNGIAQCADVVQKMIDVIGSATKVGRECYLEVK